MTALVRITEIMTKLGITIFLQSDGLILWLPKRQAIADVTHDKQTLYEK